MMLESMWGRYIKILLGYIYFENQTLKSVGIHLSADTYALRDDFSLGK